MNKRIDFLQKREKDLLETISKLKNNNKNYNNKDENQKE